MNKYIARFSAVLGCALMLSACDDNSWNDKLDGFDENANKNTATQTVNYTMTATDYAQLAGLAGAKSLAEADGVSASLTAMGADGCFNADIDPEKYLPFFLAQSTFPYFALNNGSAVKVTYLTTGEYPNEVLGVLNGQKYTVSAEDYQKVWGSDTDYAEAFSPSKPAARNIPALLKEKYPAADSADYVVVTYNQAQVDPNFGSSPEEPKFELSNVLGTLTSGASIDVNAYVAAVSTQGPVLADAAGSIFCYRPTNNNSLKLGDQVTVSASVGGYNSGFQIGQGSTPEVMGTQSVTYPTPKVMTAAEIDARAAVDKKSYQAPIYARFTGEVLAGNYINIKIDGATAQISVYGASSTLKGKFTAGQTVTVDGYVVSTSTSNGTTFLNTVVTKVGSDEIKDLSSVKAPLAGSRVATVASNTVSAVYMFDGSAWTLRTDYSVLSHADYQAMGCTSDDLSGSKPDEMLPIYLRNNFPYAQTDEVRYIVYNYYNGSGVVTRVARCLFDGGQWTGGFSGATLVTAQYVKKDGKWMYSPDVTITLPAGRNQPLSTLYYQTCVDWIKDNVPDGANYIDAKYGNDEVYCGTSAFQGNVDIRPGAAREQYAAGWEGYTDEEIVATEKLRFEKEVFPAALSILHPDAAPTASGVQPLFTIHFFYYDVDRKTHPATIIYRVVALGTFEYVSCTWND